MAALPKYDHKLKKTQTSVLHRNDACKGAGIRGTQAVDCTEGKTSSYDNILASWKLLKMSVRD